MRAHRALDTEVTTSTGSTMLLVGDSDEAQKYTAVDDRTNLIWPQDMSCPAQTNCNRHIYEAQEAVAVSPKKEAEKFWSRGEGWELKTQNKDGEPTHKRKGRT